MNSDARTAVGAHQAPNARWFIHGLGVAQIASWGSLYYSFPQIAEAMQNDLGLSRTSLYGAATLGILLSGIAAYPVGTAIDRGHGRILMAGGSALAGVLLCAWALVDGLPAFYVVLAGIGALQATTLYEPAFAVVARRFGPLKARRGITALTLWGGFASTVFIPLTEALIGTVGWRGALVALGLVNMLLCASVYARLIDPRADAATPRDDAPKQHAATARGPLRAALLQPVFWLLAVSFTAHAATFSVLTFHLYPLLLEQGLAPAAVVTALAVIGPSQVAARILVRVLAPDARARTLGSLVVLGFPVSVILLALAPPGLPVAMAAAAIYGGANGVMTIVRGLVVPEMISRRGYGAINGALTAPQMLARALGPVAAAALWSVSGSYGPVLAAALAVSIILAGGFWAAAACSRDIPAQ